MEKSQKQTTTRFCIRRDESVYAKDERNDEDKGWSAGVIKDEQE